MSLGVSVPMDYPACASKILNVNVDWKGFSDDYVYRVFGLISNDMSLKKSTDAIRYAPYFELLVPASSTQYNVYSNFDCQNTFNTNDSSQLVITDKSIQINDKRFWVMDQLVQLSGSAPSDVNAYVSVPFKSNENLKAVFKFTAQVTPSNGKPYTISEVTRQTIWIYKPQTPVYMLINTSNNTLNIYVMQSYTNQELKHLNQTNLPYLGSKLKLPEGWIFAYMILDTETYLKVVSTETAYLVQDDAKNSYQYLDPLYAPWLYQNYSYLVSI